MKETDPSVILADKLYRVFAASLDPVNIQLKSHMLCIVLDNIQQILSVVFYKLYMMIVIVQVNAVLL